MPDASVRTAASAPTGAAVAAAAATGRSSRCAAVLTSAASTGLNVQACTVRHHDPKHGELLRLKSLTMRRSQTTLGSGWLKGQQRPCSLYTISPGEATH